MWVINKYYFSEFDEVTQVEEFREEESTTKITGSHIDTITKDEKIETVTEIEEVTKIEGFIEDQSTTEITESDKGTITKDQKIETVTEIDEVTKVEEFREEESTTEITESDKEFGTKDQQIETFTESDEVTKVEEFREDESTVKDRKTTAVMFTKLLENKEVLFGETVEFTCEMSQTGLEVIWLRNNQPLSLSESKCQIVNQDYSYKLIIANVTEEDLGEYSVRFGQLQSTATLIVKG